MTSAPTFDDPLWYKDALIYELHVRAFADSDGDGIGDFPGLTQKLAYLQDLGVTAIWLLPFYPSPLKDDGYDIADYTAVHPRYGTLADFKLFLREAHRRGLRVITELVLNHTSDQHPWFQRARRSKPGSTHRDFYVWSDDPERYNEARIIFQDFEPSNWTWDPVAGAYYWHRFYAHQPDLNFDSPHVRRAIFRVVDFWLKLGVDGLRLDAVPYLYEREGTTGENLVTTHTFLKALRAHIDRRFPGRMLLAEANQWPEDAVTYFGDGDECHMAFHFPLMPRLFMATQMEDRFPVIDILSQTPPIPENAQWALFLRNHDELTLEMVTDEERIYMYRAYARDEEARVNLGIRRRLAPLMNNNRRKIELMNGLLFALPGTPVLYYGDEIGMGDNMFLGDRNGVRTPMQWSPDRNAGFSRANPQRLFLPLVVDHEYHFETVNVEAQQRNPHSLLAWIQRLIALRKRFHCFGRGTLELLHPGNPRVLAFVRRLDDECVLVVANLSRFAQMVELDLQAFAGMVPVEMFGRDEFPAVGEEPYRITLTPHSFLWFALSPQPTETTDQLTQAGKLPTLAVTGSWDEVVIGKGQEALRDLLPDYLQRCAWFGGKARPILGLRLLEAIPVPIERQSAYLTLWQVEYAVGEAENYLLPLALATGRRAAELEAGSPEAVVARLCFQRRGGAAEGLLYDAVWEPAFAQALLRLAGSRRRLVGQRGALAGTGSRRADGRRSPISRRAPTPRLVAGPQNNSSVAFGEQLIMKLLRHIDGGTSPELEMGSFLTARGFPHAPPLIGALEYHTGAGKPTTLAVLHRYVAHRMSGRDLALQALDDCLRRARRRAPALPPPSPCADLLLALADGEGSGEEEALLGDYQETAALLGRRTAELHRALAGDGEDEAFAPDGFTPFAQRALYQALRNLAGRTLGALRRQLAGLPEEARADAKAVLAAEAPILERFAAVLRRPIRGRRIRVHGDYHLEQVLHTDDDLVIIDFEGEPSRPAAYRRLRHSPLQDVVAMVRSFFDAATTAASASAHRADDEQVAHAWAQYAAAAFLRAYIAAAAPDGMIPEERDELELLLDILLLERALYEVQYDLNNRPERVGIALRGVRMMLTEGVRR